MSSVHYFMWGYQTHFQISARLDVERILKALDKRFEPEFYLVGFLRTDRTDRHPICVVPDECEYEPKTFSTVREQAALIEKTDPSRNSFHLHEIAQARHVERIQKRALMRAVKESVEGHYRSDGLVTFCGVPIDVDEYTVVPVLQVQRYVYESSFRLRRTTNDTFTIETGLIDATIGELLSFISGQLRKPEPGAGHTSADTFETLRSAAKSLMYTASAAGQEMNGLHGLYETCEAISTLRYEGSSGLGDIVISRNNHPDVRLDVEFATPIGLGDFSAVRKTLQLTSSGLNLICDSSTILGLGHVRDSYDLSREDIFTIRFKQQFVWEVLHAGQVMMHVRFGRPQLRAPGFDRPQFCRDLPRTIKQLNDSDVIRLADLAAATSNQSHGALLVISKNAASEADRLSRQAIVVRPFKVQEVQLRWLTSIDGAVLIDEKGTCFAFGAILDGSASHKCSPSRGARFNSAVRYVQGHAECIAIVKSEDGDVDFLPKLMPTLRRSLIDERLESLRELAASDTIESTDFNKAYGWLDSHRFYLMPQVCEELNALIAKAASLVKDGGFVIIPNVFQPSDDMNESYLTE
jgi:hypothetical protein